MMDTLVLLWFIIGLVLCLFQLVKLGYRLKEHEDREIQPIIDAIKNSEYDFFVSARGGLTKKRKKVVDKQE